MKNKSKLFYLIKKMTHQERKDWIYQHTDDFMIFNIILDMEDDEVEKTLNEVK